MTRTIANAVKKWGIFGLILFLPSCVTDYAIVNPEEKIVYVDVPVEDTGGYEEHDYHPGDVWVAHFYQIETVEEMDILWVIDTSGSMNTHKVRLLDGIAAMMSALPMTDWRLAMIPADGTAASTEYQHELNALSSLQDAEDMYNAMNTGHREEGFDAVYEYLTNNTSVQTAGWLRPDAGLLVVFVSDEEEQGDQFTSAMEFVSWYSMLRPAVFLASIVNHDPSISTCNSTPTNNGDRYMEATNLVSGVIVDICSEDWTAGVTDATTNLEPITEKELSHIPIEETIIVLVDGVEYDSSLWYYDAPTNMIIFTATSAESGELIGPPAGGLVEIGYIIEGSQEEISDTGL